MGDKQPFYPALDRESTNIPGDVHERPIDPKVHLRMVSRSEDMTKQLHGLTDKFLHTRSREPSRVSSQVADGTRFNCEFRRLRSWQCFRASHPVSHDSIAELQRRSTENANSTCPCVPVCSSEALTLPSVRELPKTSSEPINQVLKSEDIWEKALKLVQQSIEPPVINLDQLESLEELVVGLRQVIQERADKSCQGRMGKFLHRVDKYFSIVDVAIQHHPDVK